MKRGAKDQESRRRIKRSRESMPKMAGIYRNQKPGRGWEGAGVQPQG